MDSVAQHIYTADATLLFAFITSMVVCFLTTPVVIRVANLKQLVDEPNARSSHAQKTATLGGLSIFAAVLIGFTIWGNFNLYQGISLQYIISSLVILFFMGLKDDILELSPLSKLIAQVLAALIVVYGARLRIGSLFGLFGVYDLPPVISVGLTVLVFIAIINSYNLSDGIDGLAASIGIVAALAFGFWFYKVGHWQLSILAATLIGALVGFLRYNFSEREKIFMGDTGSMIVGFILAVFTIKFIQMNELQTAGDMYIKNAPFLAICVLIIPVFDTLRVLSMRVLTNRPPFYPDRSHIHHILIDKGFTHLQASGMLFIVNILIVVGAYFLIKDSPTNLTAIGFLVAFLVYAWIFRKYSKTANYNPFNNEEETDEPRTKELETLE